MRRISSTLATAAIALFALPAGAQAAQLFGSGFVNEPEQTACEMLGPCTVAAFVERPAEGQLSEAGSPITGVITKFRIEARIGETPVQVTFRVANVVPVEDGEGHKSANAAATGSGPTVTLTSTAAEEAATEHVPIKEFAGRLPVTKGQHLAIDASGPLVVTYAPGGDKQSYEYAPPLVDGASPKISSNFLGDLLVQATVEPDADHDGFGDETQDACPSQKATHGACDRTKPAISGLKVKRGKIAYRLSEQARVSIVIAKRSHGHFKQVGRKFSGTGKKGANSVRLPHAGSLVPGAYRVTVTATDPGGNRSLRKAAFTIAG